MHLTDYRALLDQLSTLLASGIPIIAALAELGRSGRRSIAAAAGALGVRIASGSTLGEAMASSPALFPPAHAALVGAAERAGAAPAMLLRLRDDVDRKIAARRKLLEQSAYPILLLVAAAVLPPIHLIIEGRLPAYLAFEAAIFGSAAAIVVFIRAFWPRISEVLARVPLAAGWLRRAHSGESLSLLGLLTGAGIGIREALGIAAGAARSPAAGRALEDVARRLEKGETLAGAIERLPGLSSLELSVIATGERAGRLDTGLASAGRSIDEWAARSLGRLLRALAVLIFAVVAIVIGMIYINAMLGALAGVPA